ncbi:MAG: PTS sugar transporter subunit IIA [Tissierellia bacterium]|nr:PTS sugar transporter subunit IIA [Tissierellia bacterium]
MDNELIYRDLIFVNQEFDSQYDMISYLNNILEEKGFVKDTFLENVLKREEKYPTGLDTGDIKVALPHTDSENVKKSCVTVCTLKKPILFGQMDDPQNKIEANIVFILAVKDPEQQVPVLAKLMEVFADSSKLKDIYESKNTDDIYEILTEMIK